MSEMSQLIDCLPARPCSTYQLIWCLMFHKVYRGPAPWEISRSCCSEEVVAVGRPWERGGQQIYTHVAKGESCILKTHEGFLQWLFIKMKTFFEYFRFSASGLHGGWEVSWASSQNDFLTQLFTLHCGRGYLKSMQIVHLCGGLCCAC